MKSTVASFVFQFVSNARVCISGGNGFWQSGRAVYPFRNTAEIYPSAEGPQLDSSCVLEIWHFPGTTTLVITQLC
jgi:hypothetical protein